MTNKMKRVISELDVAEELENANFIDHETKNKVKKAKLNADSAQTGNKAKGTQLIKPSQVNSTNASDESKKLKKKKINNTKLGFQVSDANSNKQDIKARKDKVVDENAMLKKKLKKLKAKQLKREKRKQLRKEHGQYKVEDTMSPDVMRQKIDEIQNRENLTKTAKRKLRILKKKLSIAEGTALPSPKIQADEENTTKLTKSQKKKLRQEKLKLQNVPQNQKNALNILNDQKLIKKKVVSEKGVVKKEFKTEFGNKKNKVGLNNEKLQLDKSSNLKTPEKEKNLQKAARKIKIPIKNENESSEENDDQSDSINNESEDESSEEVLTQTDQLIQKKVPIKMDQNNTSDEEDDEDDKEDEANIDEEDETNDDEEDEANDDEEDEAGDEKEDDEEKESDDESIDKNATKLPIQKMKKEPKEKKNISAAKISNQENGNKKKRYVLFVGNLPFKATTEDIKQHFLQKVSEVVNVRIPTAKGTKKPRGFAYVEVTNNVDYEKALSLHQTSLQGFKINVEYTQTGSKNIKNRQEIVAKNKKLHAIRKAGKLAGSKKENSRRSFRRNFKKNQQGQQK